LLVEAADRETIQRFAPLSNAATFQQPLAALHLSEAMFSEDLQPIYNLRVI